MNIAVIPARGGSKRIPRKNIKPFAGRPMIAHAIDAAKASGLFSHVVVSTDDEEIAAIANEYGAETPFMRPGALADDHTPTVPVVAHAIAACEALGWHADFVCCIYPAVPFIQVADIKGALDLLVASKASYCFPVTGFPSAIQRALKRGEAGLLSPFFPGYELTRTQDLEPAFRDAGLFYWGMRDAWFDNPRIHSGGVGLMIPASRVIDIDTPEDWDVAQLMLKAIQDRKTEEHRC